MHFAAVSIVRECDIVDSWFGTTRHDTAHKLIRKWDATDASVHDSQKLDDVLDLSNLWLGLNHSVGVCAAAAPGFTAAGVPFVRIPPRKQCKHSRLGSTTR